jgi:hypothetical protein
MFKGLPQKGKGGTSEPDTAVPLVFSSSVITPSPAEARSQIKVVSNVALTATKGQPVTVERAIVTQAADGTVKATSVRIAGKIDNTNETDGITIDLLQRLPNGETSPVTVTGLTDYYGAAVNPTGKIVIGGAPSNVADAFITTSFSATAGVHMTPAFGATGALAPWHPAVRAVFWPGSTVRVDPSVNFDVGTATTQSKNSVIIPSFFSVPFYFGLPNLKPPRNKDMEVKLTPKQDETQWIPKGTRPSVLNLSFGPRFEIDTQYGGVNALGELRGELYLPSLSESAGVKQAALASGNPSIRDLLYLPNNGYAFAPYVQADGGGHITSQTESSGKSSVTVPTYDIGRVYLGIYGTVQRGIFTFSVDSSYVDIFSTETVAYTSNKVLYLRRVVGWQPNTTAGVAVTFDQAKHYGLTLGYQNGRSAPNFAYLNKVIGGVKVTY